MKFNIQYTITALFLFGGIALVSAQKKDENIGTEVVNVVKPYTPTISDAFKVKETPALEDDDNTKKEIIKYNIFSFPVASTFTPSKGRAAGVDKSKQEQLFKNYLTTGFGNYLTAFAELYVTDEVGDTDYVAAMVKHLSSNGGIKGAELDDKYLNTSIDLTYGSKAEDYSWNVDAGYQIQKYFWYGLPSDYGITAITPDERAAVVRGMDQLQTYNNAYVSGRIGFDDSMFNSLALKYNRFWDAYGSSENRLLLKPALSFDLGEKNTVKAEFIADYVGGEFNSAYEVPQPLVTTPIKYGFANFGLHPSYALTKDDWSFNIGASVYYSADMEHSNNQLYVYPNATASLKVVGDLMVFYLGADGGLEQNSFRDLTNQNPYLSPTLSGIRPNEIGLKPTDKQLDAFAGLKGKLSNYVSYNVRGSLVAERNKVLFKSNPYDETILVQEQYQYGNSFGIVYDNVRTLKFFGELKADFNKNISFGINGSFHKYTTKFEQEAWNLPEIKFGANLDINVTEKWFVGADVFFVGERKDFQYKINDPQFPDFGTVKTLNSYFDANAHLGYKYSERLTIWLKGNNLANNSYEKWLNYPVQAIQGMVGASYKFDF